MKLEKIRKGLEQAKAQQEKEIKNKIKAIDFTTAEKNWNCWKWNGGTIYTEKGLTEKEEQKTDKEKRAALLKKELKIIDKKYQKHFEKLAKLEAVEFIPSNIEIAIDWTASRTWGNNPKAAAWLAGCGYYESSRVGGCGYDKRSTAAAEALGQSLELQAAAFALFNTFKQKEITAAFLKYVDFREFFGYGLHLGALYCNFGAGCGMGAILEELEALGYRVTARHEPQRGGDFYKLEANTKGKRWRTVKKALQGGKNGK